MACNCKKSGAKMSYVFTNKAGQTQTFDSEIKARRAQIKEGGSWRAVSA